MRKSAPGLIIDEIESSCLGAISHIEHFDVSKYNLSYRGSLTSKGANVNLGIGGLESNLN